MTDSLPLTDLQRWALMPFESPAELAAAVSSPRYSNPYDSAFRKAVEQKMAISSLEGDVSGTRIAMKTKSYRVTAATLLPGEEPIPNKEAERGLAELEAEYAEQQARRSKQPVDSTIVPPHTV